MKTKLITLENGLKIIICSDSNKQEYYVKMVTKIGGLTDKLEDGTNIITGTAHLMEHYIFENNKYGIIKKELVKNKALTANACTNNFITSFYFKTITNFNNLLEKFLDSMYTVTFTQDRLTKTKQAVYSEIRDHKNNISKKIYEAKIYGIFKKKSNTLGNKEDIDNIDYKYLEHVYNNVFVPGNQILLIGGNLNIEESIKVIKKIYSKYKFNKSLKAITISESSNVYKKETYIKDKVKETFISYKFSIDNYSNYELYKLDTYFNIYIESNFSIYSDLNEKLKKDNIILDNLLACLYIRNNCYVLELSAYTIDDKKFVEYVDDYIKNINNVKEEFELFKEQFRTTVSIRSDDLEHYLMLILDNYISFNYFHVDSIYDVDDLNFNEYIEYINKLDFSNKSILYVQE